MFSLKTFFGCLPLKEFTVQYVDDGQLNRSDNMSICPCFLTHKDGSTCKVNGVRSTVRDFQSLNVLLLNKLEF